MTYDSVLALAFHVRKIRSKQCSALAELTIKRNKIRFPRMRNELVMCNMMQHKLLYLEQCRQHIVLYHRIPFIGASKLVE